MFLQHQRADQSDRAAAGDEDAIRDLSEHLLSVLQGSHAAQSMVCFPRGQGDFHIPVGVLTSQAFHEQERYGP